MASYRHLARIAVMQTIFAYEFRKGVEPGKTLEYCISEFYDKLKDPIFAQSILKGVISHRKKIEALIQKFAPEWPIDKIARVDRAILEIGVYEILFSEDVPPVVAINEGVEIAKAFGDTNSPKFINGVLSAIMQSKIKSSGRTMVEKPAPKPKKATKPTPKPKKATKPAKKNTKKIKKAAKTGTKNAKK